MPRFSEGDCVRIDIPDKSDPDYEEYHGKGEKVDTFLKDEAGVITRDKQDGYIFRVEFDSEHIHDFRQCDLRPPPES